MPEPLSQQQPAAAVTRADHQQGHPDRMALPSSRQESSPGSLVSTAAFAAAQPPLQCPAGPPPRQCARAGPNPDIFRMFVRVRTRVCVCSHSHPYFCSRTSVCVLRSHPHDHRTHLSPPHDHRSPPPTVIDLTCRPSRSSIPTPRDHRSHLSHLSIIDATPSDHRLQNVFSKKGPRPPASACRG